MLPVLLLVEFVSMSLGFPPLVAVELTPLLLVVPEVVSPAPAPVVVEGVAEIAVDAPIDEDVLEEAVPEVEPIPEELD
jgi:hypothetical protein